MGKARLVGSSFLMLFVELALIRWTGSNVVYLWYFANFVLLGSFLGIGLGFLTARSKVNLFPWTTVLLAFFVSLVLAFPISIRQTSEDLIFFGLGTSGLPVWIVLPFVFAMVTAIMCAIAQGVARSFLQFEPLEAYRLDIAGSILGVVVFSLLSFSGAPPLAWGVIVCGAYVALCERPMRALQVAGIVVLLGALGQESLTPGVRWSPYNKLTLRAIGPGAYTIWANGIPHQTVAAVSTYDATSTALYFFPYSVKTSKRLDRVLVVGAGNGVDTAVALEHGARYVDSVEIDPRIYEIGRRYHPNHPYQDPRVHIHIDDGRAFLERDAAKYDLIVFALPDSLTLVSGQSALRLESYLFTVEAMEAARAHLRADGVFAMYNLYREPWLVDRLARTLDTVFGHPPCIVRPTQHTAALADGLAPADTACAMVWQPLTQPVPLPVHDDRPFLYVREPVIPALYAVTLALIALCSLIAIRLAAGPFAQMRPYADLFFMGAAFLLLETKSVVQFALLFGSTWFVNALVFFGILVAVYAAIETAKRFTIRNPAIVYAALIAWLALAWAIEPARLLSLDAPLRLAAAIALSFGPIFLANVIFADRFRSVATSTVAFGTNLLGAMLGGVLEYGSLLVGYRNLLVVVALLYVTAGVIELRERTVARRRDARGGSLA